MVSKHFLKGTGNTGYPKKSLPTLASGIREGDGKPFPWDIGSDVFRGLRWLEVSIRLIARGLG